MFAARASWDLTPNELAHRVEARRAAGLALYDLAESNPTRCGLPAAGEALRHALGRLAREPRVLRYEPSAKGDPLARAAIAAHHAARGAPLDAERVVLTAGTSEGYAHLFRLLGDPGDRVLVPRPSYPLFEFLAGLEGLEVAPYPLRLDRAAGAWRPDLGALARAADARTRAVVVVHPNNPTGSFLRSGDVSALRALCRERGLALIADEVFADYADAPPRGAAWPPSLLTGGDADDAPLGFVLSGVSKLLGLPQLKLAWIAVSGPARLREEALARLEVVADTYLSVSAPAAFLAAELLPHAAVLQQGIAHRVGENLSALDATLARVKGVERLPRDGGWYALLRIDAGAGARAPDEDAWVATLLEQDGVLVQPGWLFELEDEGGEAAHLVLSLLPAPEVFVPALEALARRLATA